MIFLLCVPWFCGGFGLSRYILSVGLFCKLLELIYLLAPSMLYSSSMLLNNLVRDNGVVCNLVVCNAKESTFFWLIHFHICLKFCIYRSIFVFRLTWLWPDAGVIFSCRQLVPISKLHFLQVAGSLKRLLLSSQDIFEAQRGLQWRSVSVFHFHLQECGIGGVAIFTIVV